MKTATARPPRPGNPLPDAAAAAVAAPDAVADAAAVVASGALPYAIAPDTPGAAPFLAALRTAIDQYRARAMAERWDDGPPGDCKKRTGLHRHVGFHGVFNWGDWNFPGFRDETKGCDAWGNLEYDLAYVLGLAYLATGDPELRPPVEAAAVHFRDVDVIHHWPGHADRVGLNHPHKVRHFATDAPNTVDLGHVWLDGLLLHYRLTGEARSLQAVRRMADDNRVSSIRRAGFHHVVLGVVVFVGLQADAPRIHKKLARRRSNAPRDVGVAAQNNR